MKMLPAVGLLPATTRPARSSAITIPKSLRTLHGFTLIELLVVIAIISLLVSILLPSLAKARQIAKMVVCSTQIRQLTIATSLYAEDNGGMLPRILPYDQISQGRDIRLVRDYVGEQDEIFLCPGYYDSVRWPTPPATTYNAATSYAQYPSKSASRKLDTFIQENAWLCDGTDAYHMDIGWQVNVGFIDAHVEPVSMERILTHEGPFGLYGLGAWEGVYRGEFWVAPISLID